MKKVTALFMAALIAVSASACGSSTPKASTAGDASSSAASTQSGTAQSNIKIGLATDTGGVSDQSVNQSAWEGLQALQKETGVKVSYLEPKQAADYATNLDKLVNAGNKLVWGIGFAMADSVLDAAKTNPDVNFAIVDNNYEKTPSNLTGVMFRAEESSFLVGYIAGRTTKTNKVGFVGGMKSSVIDQFQYGYQGGVAYAAKELGKTITVEIQYAESFSDASKGKAIASKMFSGNCDIVFHAAAGVGVGVIQAAKESGKYAIGVDRDQAYLAPKNVLTSALKLVNNAISTLSKEYIKGTAIGGKSFNYGLTENAVGIPKEHALMGDSTYNAAIGLEDKIMKKTIVPPVSKETFAKFVADLK